MARAATGPVVVRKRQAGRVFALRFSAGGERQYVTLGTEREGWNPARASEELANVLADVRRGSWKRPHPEPAPKPVEDPTFHEFASEWWASKRREVGENTRVDYEWQLVHHLLPFFAQHRLSQITVAEVDRYRRAKVAERRLSAASINKTLTRLGQVLDLADEYGLIQRNPLRVNPRNRKLKAVRPPAVWLDRAEQIEALLAAAAELDRRARPDRRHVPRQAILATLVFAGLRLGELLSLRWRDVDLAAGRLYVAGERDDRARGRHAKTEAGVRHVELLPALRETLAVYKLGCQQTAPDELVFATSRGRRFSRDNVRDRVFARAVEVANEQRTGVDLPPLPEGLTPHRLRHTCCSLLFACGYELPRVMAMLGHADKDVTLRIYAHVMDVEAGERNRLRALVEGAEKAPMRTSGDMTDAAPAADVMEA
jgi:integrase